MMQPAKNRLYLDVAALWTLDGSRHWTVLLQSQVSSTTVVPVAKPPRFERPEQYADYSTSMTRYRNIPPRSRWNTAGSPNGIALTSFLSERRPLVGWPLSL